MILFSDNHDDILEGYQSDLVPWPRVDPFTPGRNPTMPVEAVWEVLWESLGQKSNIAMVTTNTRYCHTVYKER